MGEIKVIKLQLIRAWVSALGPKLDLQTKKLDNSRIAHITYFTTSAIKDQTDYYCQTNFQHSSVVGSNLRFYSHGPTATSNHNPSSILLSHWDTIGQTYCTPKHRNSLRRSGVTHINGVTRLSNNSRQIS